MVFSFKALQTGHEKFRYESRPGDYFSKVLERLKTLSTMTLGQLRLSGDAARFHRIDFSQGNVSENSFGLPMPDCDEQAWQFSISTNAHGRVHGYIVDHVFHVVWLDPDHLLYPGQA